jgi:predicted Zn-dependent protease with MMP-like domain
MHENGLRYHPMVEIEDRGSEVVIADAIAEALDGPDCIYLSVDIDVVDPGMAPGTGTPEAGGMLSRELLRAVRQIVLAVDLVGMDVVEVSPPYDHSEITAILAHRLVMEAIGALAVKKRDSLPSWVIDRLENVEVIVEDRPPPGEPNLLGRYHGIPLTERRDYAGVLPDTITLYRRTIERVARDDEHLKRVVAHTVEHEVAHFFGISDERLRELDAY